MGAQSYSQWELLLLDNGQEKESYSYNMHMVKTEATQLMQLDIASLFKSALLLKSSTPLVKAASQKAACQVQMVSSWLQQRLHCRTMAIK